MIWFEGMSSPRLAVALLSYLISRLSLIFLNSVPPPRESYVSTGLVPIDVGYK